MVFQRSIFISLLLLNQDMNGYVHSQHNNERYSVEYANQVTVTLLNLHLAIRNIIPAKARRDRKETRTSP